jgi:hypothetical protein
MKTQILFVDFVKDYGLKEGIILSELCRRTLLNGSAAYHFSVIDCARFFEYLSEKQLRTVFRNLLGHNCICKISAKKAFNRTMHYQVSSTAYQAYFNAVIAPENSAPNSCRGIS